ncbi:unnamed protein product [Lampetra planeri]
MASNAAKESSSNVVGKVHNTSSSDHPARVHEVAKRCRKAVHCLRGLELHRLPCFHGGDGRAARLLPPCCSILGRHSRPELDDQLR